MKTKLTLRLDSELIQSAKRYSERRGKSLSQITAEYYGILSLVEESSEIGNATEDALPPITRFLKGLLRESDVTVDDYRKHLEEKYL